MYLRAIPRIIVDYSSAFWSIFALEILAAARVKQSTPDVGADPELGRSCRSMPVNLQTIAERVQQVAIVEVVHIVDVP